MKIHRNAERLIGYLREEHEPVTITRVAIAGVMNRQDASHAMQYGVRQGAIERIKVRGARSSERVVYRLTGQQLPSVKKESGARHSTRCSRRGALRVCRLSYPER